MILEFPDPLRMTLPRMFSAHSKIPLLAQIESLITIGLMCAIPQCISRIIQYANESKFLINFMHMNDKIVNLSNPTPGTTITAVRYPKFTHKSNKVGLLAIAYFEEWHGIDRILQGIRHYHSLNLGRSVHLTLVGEFNKKIYSQVTKIITEHALEGYVTFKEATVGEDLIKLICENDIGIGTLAFHRVGHKFASPLKSGLYCGSGLPFISSCTDPRFKKSFPYMLEVSSSEESINMEEILRWYDSIDKSFLAKDMHTYFNEELNNDKLIKPLVVNVFDANSAN